MQATREIPSGSAPEGGAVAMRSRHRLFARVVRWITWLRASRRLVVVLTVTLIAIGFVLDLAVPGYAIAGFYLVPILLAAFAFPGRYAAMVGVLALGLTVLVMLIQDRWDAQNILLVSFAALSAAGLFALAYLYNRFDQLYESERRTTSRLHVLTSQLRALQEAAILDPAPRQETLLARIAEQARQLLGSDACDVYRLHGQTGTLDLEAEAGPSRASTDDGAGSRAAAARAVTRRAAVIEGSHLAVPLFVRDDVYGAVVLGDRDGRVYHDEDVRIAQTFGDQAALAVENARLREHVERAAAAAERVRLARELHDSVTQSLFAASLEADVVAEICPVGQPGLAEALDDLRRLTRGALAEMRTMLLEMRPDGLVSSPQRDPETSRRSRTEQGARHHRPHRRQPCATAGGRPSGLLPRGAGGPEQRAQARTGEDGKREADGRRRHRGAHGRRRRVRVRPRDGLSRPPRHREHARACGRRGRRPGHRHRPGPWYRGETHVASR